MKKTSTALVLLLFFMFHAPAYAQFGLKALGLCKSDEAASGPAQSAANGDQLIKLVTAASDQGMLALDELASAFPPDRVARFESISEQYHQAQKERTNNNINAEQIQQYTNALQEMSGLEADWKLYKKDRTAAVRQADRRLGIMLIADSLAATKVPAAVQSLQTSAMSIAHNPLKMSQIKQIKNEIQLFTIIGQQIPMQKSAVTNVRMITKNIANAEKMTLPADPAPEKVGDAVSVQAISTNVN